MMSQTRYPSSKRLLWSINHLFKATLPIEIVNDLQLVLAAAAAALLISLVANTDEKNPHTTC